MKDENKTKKHLINELSELRKRNAELEKAETELNHIKETLIASEEHFHSVAISVTDAIITVDMNANIVFWNKAAEGIFGYTADEVINKPLTIIMPQRLHAADINGFMKVVSTEHSSLFGKYVEGTMLTKEDLEFPVELSRSMWKTSKGIFVTAIIRDITERKKAEEEVKKAKDYLDNIIESSLDGIIISDSRGYVTSVNDSFLKLIGYKEEELIGKHISELTPYEEGAYDSTTGEMVEIDEKFIVDATEIAGNKLFEEGKILNWNSYYLRKDKKIVPVEVNIAYLNNEEGNIIGAVGINRDITERKQIERALRKSHQELEKKVEKRTATLKLTNEQLQQEIISRKQAEEKLIEYQNRLKSLASQITLTEEKERKRFAEYLHNQVGQILFGLKLKLGTLRNTASFNAADEILDDSLKIIVQLINDTRSLTFELSPPILYQLGLEAALEWLIEQTNKQYGIGITFEDDKQEKPLDDDMKIFIFQAVRELLTNIFKHARAENAGVSVWRDSTHIHICVEDDGVSFAPASEDYSKDDSKGFGLFSIEERLDHLGGQFEVDSQPGRGTRATLVAPLKATRGS